MAGEKIICPHCGKITDKYLTPSPTVDIVIGSGTGIVLIKRKNPPYGWAIPGGFVDYGESVEHAAVREAKEETGLDVKLTGLLGVYSDPARDPRFHTISTVFMATAEGMPVGHDDAEEARVFQLDNLPKPLAFDHARILADYAARKTACTGKEQPFPIRE